MSCEISCVIGGVLPIRNLRHSTSSECCSQNSVLNHGQTWLTLCTVVAAAVLLVLFSSTSIAALSVDGIEGVLCTEEDRAQSVGSMDIYVKGSGVDIACWRHRHPNDIDDVFIPEIWATTSAYAPRAKELINAAYRSISQSRQSHGSLLQDMPKPMSLLLAFDLGPGDADIVNSAAALAANPAFNADRCLITYKGKDPFSTINLSGDSIDDFMFIVSHEIAHCFQYEHMTVYDTTPRWIVESSANLFASQAFPSANTEHRHVAEYDLEGRDFRQPYSAFILLEYATQAVGIDRVMRLTMDLFEFNDVEDQYGLVNEAMDFHSFVVQHYQQRIPDRGGCSGVSCSYPRESDLSNAQTIVVTASESSSYALPVPVVPGGHLIPVTVTIPPEYDVLFKGYSSSTSELHLSTNISESGNISDSFNRWFGAVKLAGNCNSSQDPEFLFTHMEVESVDDLTIDIELFRIEECSDTESQTYQTSPTAMCQLPVTDLLVPDRCLIGQWIPSRQEMAAQFEHSMRQTVLSVEGSFVMELCPGGDGYFSVDEIAIQSEMSNAGSMIIGIDGAGDFQWTTTGTEFMSNMGDFDYNASAQMMIGGMNFDLPDIPFTNTLFPKGGVVGSYDCSETKLEFFGIEDGSLYKSWSRL